MGDKIVISEIELLYGRLFQIDLHNESKDEWYRVFCDKDELYTMLKNTEKENDVPRYIDADKIDLNKYPIGRSLATDWIDIEDVKRAIALTPTADVVPKSEVERLKRAYEGSQKTIKGLTEMIREKNKELAKLETHLELHYGEKSLNNLIAKERAETKQEVVREIFEEIEKVIDYGLSTNAKGLTAIGGRANGKTVLLSKRAVLTELKKYIAELKAKYDKDCRTCKHLVSCEPNPFGNCDEYTEGEK